MGGMLSEQAFSEAIAPMIPVNEERRQAGQFLAHLMSRFAWLHEHFHVVNGHLDWLSENNKSSGLVEFIEESAPNAITPGQTLRPIEFDADRSAFHALCSIQLTDRENIVGLAALPFQQRMILNLFAAYAMTWLFDAYGRRTGRPSESHPDPYLRLHNLMRTLASNIAADLDNTAVINQAALKELETLRAVIPDLPSGDQILRDFQSPAIQSSLDDAGTALGALRTKWAPYKYT